MIRRLGPAWLYLAFFLILFVQYPLGGNLPGNTDSWLVGIAIPNTLRATIAEWLGGGAGGQWLYPAAHPLLYGETALGTGVLFASIRTLVPDDVIAYYFFISLVFASSCTGLYLLARTYLHDRAAALLAGFAFGVANFTLANIDSPHTSFYGLAFVSLYLLRRHLAGATTGFLYAAAALIGLQVYCSSYVFVFTIVWAAVSIVSAAVKPGRALRASWRAFPLAGLLCAAVAAPFFVVYFAAMRGDDFVNPLDAPLFAATCSLDPGDLTRALPGNLLYPAGEPFSGRQITALRDALGEGVTETPLDMADLRAIMGPGSPTSFEAHWPSVRRRAHVGWLLWGLAVIGAVAVWRRPPGPASPTGTGRRDLLELACVGALGLLLAAGPVVSVGGRVWPTPLFPLYDSLATVRLFRVPLRAFALVVAVLAITGALGWLRLRLRFGAPRGRAGVGAWLVLALLGIAAENVPFPLPAFAAAGRAAPSPGYAEFLERIERSDPTSPPGEPRVLLELPSAIGYGGALVGDLFPQNRELIYMNWQTYHRQHVVNGLNGYLPKSRVEVQRAIDSLPSPAGFAALRRHGVHFLVLHYDLAIDSTERERLGLIRRSPELAHAYGGKGLLVLRLLDAPAHAGESESSP